MRHIKIFIAIFSLLALTAYAQEEAKEKFPKTGYVKNDSVAVKAGDNENFENLCVLSKSESVKIVDRRYSWFKILLPRKAALYVNKDYINLTSDEKGIGIINAANVNLRAGAGTRYSIIGQISKPEKVSILSEDAGWYKIEPPYGAAGWIRSDQIDAAEEDKTKNFDRKEAIKEVNPVRGITKAVNDNKISNEVKEVKKEKIKASNVRLDANYPAPKVKGNLSIH